MILSTLTLLLIGALVLLFLSAAVAPLESLGWWAGWFGDKEAPPVPGHTAAVAAPAARRTAFPAISVSLQDGERWPE